MTSNGPSSGPPADPPEGQVPEVVPRRAAYGQAVTISYDETLRERIRAHLAGHDRRTVTDPAKRHAAVAVVIVDSEIAEDRVDPAPVEDWIAGRPMPEAGLDGRMVDVSGVLHSSCAAEPLVSPRMPLSGRCPVAAWILANPRSTRPCVSWTRRSASGCPIRLCSAYSTTIRLAPDTSSRRW